MKVSEFEVPLVVAHALRDTSPSKFHPPSLRAGEVDDELPGDAAGAGASACGSGQRLVVEVFAHMQPQCGGVAAHDGEIVVLLHGVKA